MTQPAEGELDVGAQLVPQPNPTNIAHGLLVYLDAAEVDARSAFRVLTRQTSPLEIVGAVRDVALKLLIHVAFHRAAVEQMPQEGAHAVDGFRHRESGVARSAAAIAVTRSCQLERLARSCCLPAGVSE